ncbi:MAG: hypothetical protein A2509_09130 [Candidatus Edwardsbacteria bacterium RIFOXYD12_FULL_50_11]|uniref:Lipocalin-like domain-containing protein n=1 Tax=Candidatus Edwardsbacteria bacterium GWF2_54_11 TaxID=1817851 RepID=A0A1F5R4K2_9BACT|nr:MAG: hypothetical protein A2502_08740 [Candidatus Edwardsbacteria bacterium RifOxyC12_full_54_24]OGF07325.1 MAG: hypothetical protein A2273_02315 [Candidatus Edwardsbacteria bacterium RifOxyA12_full_54_48]OGF09319.1 MAG: hypothetical protein A2024_08515 [Candidatus Edwardsbacteria bacterium GWF2_54_11]OGF09577.1 MAG: hypothetical protein A3K15_08725 [Candidatus Edwardsbacteria bacterium GWE2_54_12]OGF18020.1 MAG: hypothetical protein A2509_09130 [Candidatus Edwardsbacteria bacterium RIFOXYD1
MKKLLAAIVVLIGLAFAMTAWTQKSPQPNLVGTWEGSTVSHHKDRGHVQSSQYTFVVEEQKGRMITGYKAWNLLGVDTTEAFSGIISRDGKKFYTAEHDDGYGFGDIISGTQIEVIYLESGSKPKVVLKALKKTSGKPKPRTAVKASSKD